MNSEKKPSKIPYIFFAFFAVILAVNIFYIYLSNKTWRGIETEDAYQKGLKYNDTLKAAKDQKELGWKINTTYMPVGPQEGKILVQVLDKNSQLIKGADLVINCKRPVQAGSDFSMDLKAEGIFYKSEIKFPFKGQWDVEIVATKGDVIVKDAKRYIVQ